MLVPAPAMRMWCWDVLAPAPATTAHVCTPQLNVVVAVVMIRFVVTVVGGGRRWQWSRTARRR